MKDSGGWAGLLSGMLHGVEIARPVRAGSFDAYRSRHGAPRASSAGSDRCEPRGSRQCSIAPRACAARSQGVLLPLGVEEGELGSPKDGRTGPEWVAGELGQSWLVAQVSGHPQEGHAVTRGGMHPAATRGFAVGGGRGSSSSS